MDCSMPGFPVHHQLPEFAHNHVHWVSDVIQPSHPLSSPSSPAFNLSHHLGSFQMSQLFALGGKGIGVSVSTSELTMNIQDWFPLGWTGWISLQFEGISRVFFPTPQFKSINSSAFTFLYSPTFTSIHDYCKTIALTRWTSVGKVMSLLFNMLYMLVITFLPRSKHALNVPETWAT